MSEVPWTKLTNKIDTYFKKIRESGVPDQVKGPWLKKSGWRSGDDYKILEIWKIIGFIDEDNIPTDYWRRYKVPTESKIVLADAMRKGYKVLFDMYEDAWRKDDEAIYAVFMGQTGESVTKVNQMVTVFKALVELADFEGETLVKIDEEKPSTKESTKEVIEEKIVSRKIGSTVHINIQLHLPATDDIKIYDKLFESMKKHLLTDES